MKKLMTIAALGCLASIGAPVPQASQAWVNMRLDQLKSEVIAQINAGIATTNMTDAQVSANAAATSIANAMPIVTQLATPMPYTPNPTGSVYYIVTGCADEYTNSLPNGLVLPQKTAYTWGTNDVLFTKGTATNTLTFAESITLSATTNGVMFTDAANVGWAIVVEVIR